MSRNKEIRNAVLFTAAVLAGPLIASAKPKDADAQVKKEKIELFDHATVDGKELAPGGYEVIVEGQNVRFERNGHTLVTAPCDWKTLEHGAPYSSVTLSATKVIEEIQFQGSNRALEVR